MVEILNEIPAWNLEQQLPHPEIRRRGYVYLVASSNGLFKIGRTINLHQRMWQLSSDHPEEELALIYAVELKDQFNGERWLHRKYRHKRVHGEWFNLDHSDIARILTQFQVDEMQTNVMAKYVRNEDITDADCALPDIAAKLPDDTICYSSFHPKRKTQ